MESAIHLEDPSKMSPRVAWWILLALALVAAGVYANSLRNGFAFDDVSIVQESRHVQDLDWTAIWSDNYWASKDGIQPDVLYRPLTIWSYLANQAITPGAAWAFHFANVLMHALATVMVTVLGWRLFGNRAVAVLAGFLFAIHPIHTEVVANVVGRAEILAAIWSIAALLVYLPDEPLTRELIPAVRPWWHGLLVSACFFLAMLSKETPAAMLGVFVLIDAWRWMYWPRDGRVSLWRWVKRQTVRYYTPLGVAFGIYLALRIHATGLMRDIRSVHPIVNPLVAATIPERIVTPFAILAKYLELTFWPKVLSADYSAPSLMPTANPLESLPLLGILAVALALIVAFKCRRKSGTLLLTVGLFGLSYALVANVLRIGTIMGERLFYLPSVFVLLIVAYGVVILWGSEWMKRAKLVRAALVLVLTTASVAMSVRTIVRNTDWHDNIALAIATARDNPGSAKACYWAGSTLTNSGTQPWMVEFGADLLKRSTEMCKTYPDSYWELAKYYGRKNDQSQSTYYLAETALYNPGASDVRFALNEVGTDLKAHPAESYMPGLWAGVHDHPMEPARRLALAIGLRTQEKYAEAERQAAMALRLEGDYYEALAELAMIRLDMGKTPEGLAMLRGYVMTIHSSLDARCTIAKVLMKLDPKKYPTALAEAQMNMDRAEKLGPGDVKVRELQAELKKMEVEQGRALSSADREVGAAIGGVK